MNKKADKTKSGANTEKPVLPELPYEPPAPDHYRPRIGLVGCGGISEIHLQAYRKQGYEVAALCDRDPAKARQRQREFYPDAQVITDFEKLLKDARIDVVDLTPHPEQRAPLIEAALNAGKHVLSQKPFVIDLDEGERLADLAEQRGVHLAVNQNGRWAPHFAYARQAVAAGWIGTPFAVRQSVQWDHNWIKDHPAFNDLKHIVLYDFAIHWFDFVATIFPDRTPRSVFASIASSPGQRADPPLLGHCLIDYEDAQVALTFDADTQHAADDRTSIVGTEGAIRAAGPDLQTQTVTVATSDGVFRPELTGRWFPDGFRGAMGELACAVEEGRTPLHNARDNLRSLALCFAAVESAETGRPVDPRSVRKLPGV